MEYIYIFKISIGKHGLVNMREILHQANVLVPLGDLLEILGRGSIQSARESPSIGLSNLSENFKNFFSRKICGYYQGRKEEQVWVCKCIGPGKQQLRKRAGCKGTCSRRKFASGPCISGSLDFWDYF